LVIGRFPLGLKNDRSTKAARPRRKGSRFVAADQRPGGAMFIEAPRSDHYSIYAPEGLVEKE